MRLAGLATFLFGLFTLLILQFYKIQILEGERWEKKALAQHCFNLKMPCQRGVFYGGGHQNKPLVVDIPKYHVYIDPDHVPLKYKEPMSEQLCALLDKDQAFITEQFNKKSRSRRLAKWVSYDQMVQIEGWWKSFSRNKAIPSNAVFFVKDYKRSYPYGSMLGQVLHTVRENKEPTGGLELFFNRALKGVPGKRQLLRSPRHAIESDTVKNAPRNGADIYLTIEPTLQAIAEEEIAKAVARVHAKGGWAIMLEPNSGEILALAQYPFFDPRHYNSYYNDPELTEHTKVKAITDCFEPGSTMKPLTVALALLANEELIARGEEPLFSPEEKVRSDDGLIPGTRHRIRDVTQHKYLNMKLALVKSSNVYMGKLAQRIVDRLGAKWYRNKLEEVFGFGLKSQIELPSESPGMIPTPGKTYKGGQLQWSKPTPYTLAIGYNLLATSMQMTKAFAVIANGGFDVQPTLLKKICHDGETLLDNTQRHRIRKLPEAVATQLTEALKCVTKPGGSSVRADVPGYTEAGKSGTSEKIVKGAYSKKIHFSSFVGFAPAHRPSFVLFIGIDEPEYRFIPGYGKTHYGGKCAAPVFREIAKRSLHYLGVPPDDPYGYPKGDPRRNTDRADSLAEVDRLKLLYQEWNN